MKKLAIGFYIIAFISIITALSPVNDAVTSIATFIGLWAGFMGIITALAWLRRKY